MEQLYEDEANVDFVSKRRITRHQVGFYMTLEAAEAAMRDWLKIVRHWGWSIFGCEITEHALDEKVDLEKRDYGNIQSMRTYLDTGELNASVDCDTAGVKWFCGRTEPAKVAPGLLAWCLGRDSVVLVLVVAKPPTREEWTKKPTGARRFWVASDRGDFSDDAYTVVNKDGRTFVSFRDMCIANCVKWRQMAIDCNAKKMIYYVHNSLFANCECYD